ncbi:hypothetical protein BTVI_88353 [Pitangus sulphuratus]|nr:hypothetical protein BTVI_88353 [Pitangus sulphuratus]
MGDGSPWNTLPLRHSFQLEAQHKADDGSYSPEKLVSSNSHHVRQEVCSGSADAHNNPFSKGEHLRICPQGYTCCTSEMEENFANKSRSEFEAMMKEAGRSVQATLTAQHRSFDRMHFAVHSKPRGLKATGNKWFTGKIEMTYNSETVSIIRF